MKTILPTIQVTRSNVQTTASAIRNVSGITQNQERLAKRIVADVKSQGDSALLKYSRRFNDPTLRSSDLKVPPKAIARAMKQVDRKIVKALRFSLQQLETTQKELLSRTDFSLDAKGFRFHLAAKPLASVGCYVPGGRAAYPSTVLMTAGVAKLAGVRRVVLCTPSDADGMISDVILAAAGMCQIDEVYRCGGAQAIAALAYGTETISPVDKIVGPGGIYVAAAKRFVSKDVPIDFFAGPTEILVIADRTTDPKMAAWDLVAQSEHGEDNLPILVTTSAGIARKVLREIDQILPRIERRDYVESSLARGFCAICDGWNTVASLVNGIGPEHVELLAHSYSAFAENIDSSGVILVGPYAPAAASDYCMGTNHVLPTGGFARSHQGLSVLDFVKLTWIVTGSREGLRELLQPLKALTLAEGLPNHFLSVESRFVK
jgi:histidinol dehydrogenase